MRVELVHSSSFIHCIGQPFTFDHRHGPDRPMVLAEAAQDLVCLHTQPFTAADCVFRYTVLIDEAQLWRELDRHLGRSPGPAPSRPGMVMRLVERHCGHRGVLSASQRSRLAESLELARTCGVDPALVVGFLCEIGGQRAVSNFLSKPSKLEQLAAYRRPVDRS